MYQEPSALFEGAHFSDEDVMRFSIAGETTSELVRWYAEHVRETLARQGHTFRPFDQVYSTELGALDPNEQVRLVINMADVERPRPVRRSGQGTFVVTVFEGSDNDTTVMQSAYPLLVRSLSNMIIYNTRINGVLESHFITIEQGHYVVQNTDGDEAFFERVVGRIQPLACSHLVINNEFTPDLPKALWQGDETTAQIGQAGQILDSMGLLPAAIPLEQFLTERDMRHIKRLYGMGGLSYGNLSARAPHDPRFFWMSASGVDKSRLQMIGRDILLVTGFDPDQLLIRLSVPPSVEPRRVSVDAIEHYMIYREHPEVGAIVHIHAWWSEPIASTQVNYPCGTYELAAEVAELVRQAPDPSRAVIGLRNHGLTITGHSIREIFERIEGMIVPQVPMS